MPDLQAIIRAIDSRLETEGKSTTDPVEANSCLDKQGLLKESKDRPVTPAHMILVIIM
jgi:hypothetical protein